MTGGELQVALEAELPSRLAVGRGNVILVRGRCRHPTARLRGLDLTFDGAEHPVLAHGMPDGAFWGLVPVRERSSASRLELGLAARLGGGDRAEAGLASIEVLPGTGAESRHGTARPAATAGDPLICICMATYEPQPDLLRAQIDSLREQDDDRWICLIADDASAPAKLAEIRELVADDPRFELHEHGERVGAYRNFERALRLVPPEAELIAFCDQDDRWHPGKLTALRGALASGAALAYSDMRVVDAAGEVLSPTYWSARGNNHTELADLVMVNTVTGAASLFRRTLLDDALPFPEPGVDSFHDHWLAVVALATGGIAYVDRPLYDYVQHPAAALGHDLANQPQVEPSLRERLAGRRNGDRLARWQRDYPYLLRVLVTAEVLRLRCGDRMTRRKRRQLGRLLRLERPRRGFGWLGWRALRARPSAPTMGKERQLLRAKLWRAVAGLRASGDRSTRA